MLNKNLLIKIISGISAFILLVALFSSYKVIQPGNVGVVFNKVTGNLSTHPQGLVFKIPFLTTVQSYPSSLRTYTMVSRAGEGSSNTDDSIDLPTKEGQHIRQDISVTFNTSEERAAEVFKAFKGDDIGDIEASFIRRTIITVAQNVAGQMSLSELISSSRDKLQTEIQENLNKELAKMGFNLDKVNLGASHLPKAIEKQMQQKMAAQQKAMEAEYEFQKQQTLAKAAVAKARGEADSEVILAEGKATANRKLQQALSSILIEYQKVQKWDGVLPTMMMGNGAVPFINLNKKEGN